LIGGCVSHTRARTHMRERIGKYAGRAREIDAR